VARALAAAAVASLLAVSGAGGSNAQTPKRGGTVVSTRPAMGCLNAFAGCGTSLTDPSLMQVLEGAYEVGPDFVFRPNLVSHVTIGRNPFTLTYHIRPKARWSDGVPVTAADFRFTHRVLTTTKVPAFDVSEPYRKIRRLRILDAKTFRVELREPFADWRNLFEVVLPRHALAGQDLTAIWRNRIDNPKTRRRSAAGRSS
jgi:peptide/nickel transport system substrate-binding protein